VGASGIHGLAREGHWWTPDFFLANTTTTLQSVHTRIHWTNIPLLRRAFPIKFGQKASIPRRSGIPRALTIQDHGLKPALLAVGLRQLARRLNSSTRPQPLLPLRREGAEEGSLVGLLWLSGRLAELETTLLHVQSECKHALHRVILVSQQRHINLTPSQTLVLPLLR